MSAATKLILQSTDRSYSSKYGANGQIKRYVYYVKLILKNVCLCDPILIYVISQSVIEFLQDFYWGYATQCDEQ